MSDTTARTASQSRPAHRSGNTDIDVATQPPVDRASAQLGRTVATRDGEKRSQGIPCQSHQEPKDLVASQRRTGIDTNAYTFYNTALTSWCVKGGGAEPARPESIGKGGLRSLQLIETVGDSEPFHIVPVFVRQGTAQAPNEVMALKVKWAEKATYRVLTRRVPDQFAPYNAIIRISEIGTEDFRRDYLAEIEE